MYQSLQLLFQQTVVHIQIKFGLNSVKKEFSKICRKILIVILFKHSNVSEYRIFLNWFSFSVYLTHIVNICRNLTSWENKYNPQNPSISIPHWNLMFHCFNESEKELFKSYIDNISIKLNKAKFGIILVVTILVN